MLDEVHRIYEPGMEQFFARLQPDMWIQSIDDLEKFVLDPNRDVALRAIAIYKFRREKMLEIYRSFRDLAQLDPRSNLVIETIQKHLYAEATEQTTRRLVRCDHCQKTPELSRALKLTAVQESDGEVCVKSTCEACFRKEGAA
jgi:hypothetical protein